MDAPVGKRTEPRPSVWYIYIHTCQSVPYRGAKDWLGGLTTRWSQQGASKRAVLHVLRPRWGWCSPLVTINQVPTPNPHPMCRVRDGPSALSPRTHTLVWGRETRDKLGIPRSSSAPFITRGPWMTPHRPHPHPSPPRPLPFTSLPSLVQCGVCVFVCVCVCVCCVCVCVCVWCVCVFQ